MSREQSQDALHYICLGTGKIKEIFGHFILLRQGLTLNQRSLEIRVLRIF